MKYEKLDIMSFNMQRLKCSADVVTQIMTADEDLRVLLGAYTAPAVAAFENEAGAVAAVIRKQRDYIVEIKNHPMARTDDSTTFDKPEAAEKYAISIISKAYEDETVS